MSTGSAPHAGQGKRRVFRASLGLAVLLFSGASSLALSQTTGSAATLAKARHLYYTPVDAGLESFACEVNFDWKSFIEKATNAPVADNEPRLAYLRSIRLSLTDDLHGTGQLHWAAPGPPPDAEEDPIAKLRGGLEQIWSGFFQSWNGFFTGDLVSPDPASVLQADGSGFRVTARTATGMAEERYDPALVLRSIHVAIPTLDSTTLPSFAPSSGGLLVKEIGTTYRQPPSAEPTEITMQLAYAPVGSFQLPSELSIAVGPAAFVFHMRNCTVQTRLSGAAPSPAH